LVLRRLSLRVWVAQIVSSQKMSTVLPVLVQREMEFPVVS
jgi:hypothetical protein